MKPNLFPGRNPRAGASEDEASEDSDDIYLSFILPKPHIMPVLFSENDTIFSLTLASYLHHWGILLQELLHHPQVIFIQIPLLLLTFFISQEDWDSAALCNSGHARWQGDVHTKVTFFISSSSFLNQHFPQDLIQLLITSHSSPTTASTSGRVSALF